MTSESNVVPILLLYAEKSLNFNNNAKLYCSQPRIKPVKENSEQSSMNLGFPIKSERTRILEEINDKNYKKIDV